MFDNTSLENKSLYRLVFIWIDSAQKIYKFMYCVLLLYNIKNYSFLVI